MTVPHSTGSNRRVVPPDKPRPRQQQRTTDHGPTCDGTGSTGNLHGMGKGIIVGCPDCWGHGTLEH
jgi:hypothetical protein